MRINKFKNLLLAAFFHFVLVLISFGTVLPVDNVDGFFSWKGVSALCSILYYIAIVAATQFPSLLFLNARLNRDATSFQWPIHRILFYLRCASFWAMVFFVFYIQIAVSGDDFIVKGVKRWVFLLGLAMFFSVVDYAIPSYKRYVRLFNSSNWGSRARVFYS